jgi:hypothetical protein
VGEGHIGLVESVSIIDKCVSNCLTPGHSHRQIFGSLPKNTNEEDIVEPTVSTIDILKAQRARKAAVKNAEEESVTESESEPETKSKVNATTSENSPPTSEDPDGRLSWDFADKGAVPPGLRQKDLANNITHPVTAQHNPPIRSEITRVSTPPATSSSGAGRARPSSLADPPQVHRDAPQVSQQPRVHQAKSTQKRHSTPVVKSHRLKKSAN